MHTQQVILTTDELGNVVNCDWRVQLTPFEETIVREYVAERLAHPDASPDRVFNNVVLRHVDSVQRRFGWQYSFAAQYIETRLDPELFSWVSGLGCHADEIVAS